MRSTIIVGISALLAGVAVGRFIPRPAESPATGFPLPALAVQARFSPAIQGASVHGFRVSGVRPGSVLFDVGLRNGDVVKAIGGHPVIHSSTFPLALAALEGETTVDIDRQGEALRLACAACAQKLRDYTWQATPASPWPDDLSLRPRRDGGLGSYPAGVVTPLGNNRFRVEGGWRRLIADAAEFATQARVVPAFENGQPVGFKVFSIRPGSAVSQLGFLNGDTVNAIQGRPLTGPESVLEAYTHNLDDKVVTVTLKRNGNPVTLTFESAEEADAGPRAP